MREPLHNHANVRPFLRPRQGGNRQAYQVYQQARRRQQRLAMLFIGLLLFLGIGAAGAWGLFKVARPWVETVLPAPELVDTSELRFMLAEDIGFSTAPSLLYYNTPQYAAYTHAANGSLKDKLMPIVSTQEDEQLKTKLEQLFASYPAVFKPYFYYYNPQDGTYVNINGYKPVAAASVIKLPILLGYLQGLDSNLMRMDSPVLYTDFERAGGSGELQYQEPGKLIMANQVASNMIRISDNTCTNIMIQELGGTDAVNQQFANLGLTQTRIRNWLPDLEGTNTISPYEMVTILYNVDHGPIVSDMARYNGIGILESTHNRQLLVNPLPHEARVAHKTGDIGTALGDSGIVYMPDGGKYMISMQVERPFNDYTARDIVQRASRMVYDHVAAKRLEQSLQATATEPETTP